MDQVSLAMAVLHGGYGSQQVFRVFHRICLSHTSSGTLPNLPLPEGCRPESRAGGKDEKQPQWRSSGEQSRGTSVNSLQAGDNMHRQRRISTLVLANDCTPLV